MKYCCIAAHQPRGSREERFSLSCLLQILGRPLPRAIMAQKWTLKAKLIAVIYMSSKILFTERKKQGFGRGYWLSRQMHGGLCVCKCVCVHERYR